MMIGALLRRFFSYIFDISLMLLALSLFVVGYAKSSLVPPELLTDYLKMQSGKSYEKILFYFIPLASYYLIFLFMNKSTIGQWIVGIKMRRFEASSHDANYNEFFDGDALDMIGRKDSSLTYKEEGVDISVDAENEGDGIFPVIRPFIFYPILQMLNICVGGAITLISVALSKTPAQESLSHVKITVRK